LGTQIDFALQVRDIPTPAHPTIEVSTFGNLKRLMKNIGFNIGRGMEDQGHRVNSTLDPAENVDPLG